MALDGPHIVPVATAAGGAGGGVNIAASNTTYTSGTVLFTGGANITVSTNGQTVSIIGGAGAAAATAISGLANSETTYTSGTVSLSALGNLTIRSTTGNQFQFSVANQSVQAETQTFVGGISASNTLYTSGSVRISGSQAVTVRSGTGQLVIIDVPAQTVQAETQTFLGGLAASNTTYTSGTMTITGVGGGVTVSSNTGQRIDISVAAPVAQSVQTQNLHNVTLSGNTAGVMAQISSGTFTLAGGNNITVSQNGNAVTISGPNVGGAQTGISGIANSETTYTSGTVSLSGLANITIRSTTGNQFQFSVPGTTGTGNLNAISNSNTTFTSGTIGLSELGAITIRSTTGNQFQFSVNSQSVQPETKTFVSGIAGSNTTYTSGVVTITGVGGGVTVSSNTGQRIDISVAAPVAQTGTYQSAIAASNTTYTSGLVVFTGSNMITVKSSGAGQTVILDATQTNQSAIKGFGASNVGNTAGNTGMVSGVDWVLAGSTNVTVSQSTAVGGPNTLWLSAPNAGAGGFGGAGISGGNTSGNTGTVGSRVVFAGGNNITLSGSTNGGSMTITVSAPNLGAGAMSAGVSTGGNTAGATGITGTQMVLVGSGPISLSQTTGANGGTVSINAPATSSLSATGAVSISTNGSTISIGVAPGTATMWWPFNEGVNVVGAQGQGTLHIIPLPTPEVAGGFGEVQIDRIAVPINFSNSSNSTGSVTVTILHGLYTKNGSTISLAHSTSITSAWTFSGSASSSLHHGNRLITIPWTTTIDAQRYYVAHMFRSTTAGGNGTLSQVLVSQMNTNFSGIMGAASNASNQWPLGLGVYSVSTGALPGSIPFSDIRGTASLAARAPSWFMVSGTA